MLALLYLQALKLHINNKFLSFLLPILLIPGLPLTQLPDCLIIGVNLEYEHKSPALLKRSNPSVKTTQYFKSDEITFIINTVAKLTNGKAF